MKNDKKADNEIDALLGGVKHTSMIDALLSIPAPDQTDHQEIAWSKLLHARLQNQVSRRFRDAINLEKAQGQDKECNPKTMR